MKGACQINREVAMTGSDKETKIVKDLTHKNVTANFDARKQ